MPRRPSLVRGPEESFIDEIVNTADRRMFCRPFGRLSVAIGDHPMRLVSSTRCKKDLSSLLTDHCLSPIYLNVTFSFLIRLPSRDTLQLLSFRPPPPTSSFHLLPFTILRKFDRYIYIYIYGNSSSPPPPPFSSNFVRLRASISTINSTERCTGPE